ncbi:uncharacterized protein LOC121841113 isoform X2 [Oncorhynchus tshawytscha]|uniref:uncharacterized protein LOC121841113 isoform X2 n=1 Tax=Oncorhynchus tshawytscha TaxID=74940 RepID=UPI001C3D80AF|nr:uncharacterized protein LOC121841113 isoform X2 [Oncorhynchus tshawytscha]
MERKALLCIFFLLLPLALVSADIPVLNSISDLRNIEFGHRFPRHGLMLLHFVSGGLYVDNNDVLIPTFLPERGDWGFHYFNNYEELFPPLQDQNRQGYYAVGNINTPTAYPLYPYVTRSYYFTPGNLERNMDSYGTYDSNQYLNHGLQVKLLSKDGSNVFITGPRYDDADGKVPVGIEGNDASLQLYTKDGYACAQLFISKTFTDWQTDFNYSWVAFYSNHKDASNSYYTYEYAVRFTKQDDTNIKYDIYSYVSSLSIQPGAQARFFLTKTYDSILAETTPWER